MLADEPKLRQIVQLFRLRLRKLPGGVFGNLGGSLEFVISYRGLRTFLVQCISRDECSLSD